MSISLGDLMLKIGADPTSWHQLKETLEDAKDAVKGFGTDVTGLGTIMTGAFTVPFLAAAGTVAHFGSEFEEAKNIIVRGTGAMGDELAGLEGSFDRAFAGGDESAEEVATSIAAVNTILGLTGESLETFVGTIHDLGDVTGEELAPLVDAVTHSFQNWQVATEDQATSMDYLMNVAQAAGVSVTDLASQLTQFGPTLRALGIGFKESAAFIGQLARAGVEVGPILAGVDKAMKQFTKAGIKDPLEALQLLEERIKGAATAADAMEIAVGLFGKSAVKMVDGIRSGQVSFQSFQGTLDVGNRTIADTAEQMETITQKIGQLTNEFAVSLKPLGEAMVQIFKDMIDMVAPMIPYIADLARQFSMLAPEVQAIIIGFTGLLAAVGPALIAFGAMAKGFAEFKLAAASVTTVLGGGAGLVGALTVLGSAVAIAAAAFAGFKLGRWLDENIPALHKINEAIADFIVNGNRFSDAIKKYGFGIGETVKPTRDLGAEVQKLADKVHAAGIAISQGTNESLQQYALRVQKVAAEHKLLDPEVTKNVLSTGKFKTATEGAGTASGKLGGQLNALLKDLDGHKDKTKEVTVSLFDMSDAFKAITGDQSIEGLRKKMMESIEAQAKAQIEFDKTVEALVKLGDAAAEEVAKNTIAEFGQQYSDSMALVRESTEGMVDTGLLGVTTITSLKTAASEASAEFLKMKNATDASGNAIFSLREQQEAEITVIERQIALRQAQGLATQELEARLHELRIATGEETTQMAAAWQTFNDSIDASFENFSQDLAASLFNGDIQGALDGLLDSFKQTFQTLATTVIGDFIHNVLLGDLPGAIDSVGAHLKGLGGMFDKVFGVGGAGTKIPSVPGGGGGGGAGGVATAATSGIAGMVTAISSSISAITGILSLFGVGRQGEKDRLNIIADKTSGTSYALNEGGMKDATLAMAANIDNFVNGAFGGWFHDSFAGLCTTQEAALELLRNGIRVGDGESSPEVEATEEAAEQVTEAVETTGDGTTEAVTETTNAVGENTEATEDTNEAIVDMNEDVYNDVTGAAGQLEEAAEHVEEAGKGLLAAVDSEEYAAAKLALIGQKVADNTATMTEATVHMATVTTQAVSRAAEYTQKASAAILEQTGIVKELSKTVTRAYEGTARAAIFPTLTPTTNTNTATSTGGGGQARAYLNTPPMQYYGPTGDYHISISDSTIVGEQAAEQLAQTVVDKLQGAPRLQF